MPPVSVMVRVRARLSFSGCALKLTLLTVGLSNLWTIDTEPITHRHHHHHKPRAQRPLKSDQPFHCDSRDIFTHISSFIVMLSSISISNFMNTSLVCHSMIR